MVWLGPHCSRLTLLIRGRERQERCDSRSAGFAAGGEGVRIASGYAGFKWSDGGVCRSEWTGLGMVWCGVVGCKINDRKVAYSFSSAILHKNSSKMKFHLSCLMHR